MNAQFDTVISKVTDFLKSEAKTETVIGDQFQLGEFTCVPVIRVGLGFGFGGGEGEGDAPKNGKGKGEGSGAGAGTGIEPIGFLVTRGDMINFVSTKSNKGLNALLEKAPDILSEYLKKDGKVPASSN
ncbi:MAG: GerW family sporulation protein [Bacteroidota bacterium]|nr:GerW family sporulation protein [Bacteroidota bacterium]MDP4233923.1 GerW family sporulation protein [Bacteroidota bacterium]MDP4242827.1 GerW family sporulation protein [Bacteroidota bacterium]MDP4288305.1 GerW family sporulation protein [Bacteroidota bacterium]